jgi:DNA-binding NarL/FixJ family response regulator
MNLLILDDHPSVFLVLKSLLMELCPDIKLHYFSDVEQAIQSINTAPPECVISDIQVHHTKQLEVPKLCHEKSIPFMIFSGHINTTILNLCSEIKALCVVSKSASIPDLTEGLKALLSKKSYCCAVCSALKKSNTMTSDIIPPVLFTDSEEYVIKAQLEGKSTIELSNESKKSKFTIRNQRMSLMEKNQCTMEEIVRRYLFWHTKG